MMPQTYTQMKSGRDYSLTNEVRCRVLFDAVLYAVKIVARFYKVQYKHKTEM